MADDALPNEYDAIVLGTGMTECIIAAALSRIGHRVLHLDRNDYYSGDWGTFHFEAIQKWIAKQKGTDQEKLPVKPPKENLLQEGEVGFPLKIESTTVSNVKECVFIPEELPAKEAPSVVEEKTDTQDRNIEGSNDKNGSASKDEGEAESEGPTSEPDPEGDKPEVTEHTADDATKAERPGETQETSGVETKETKQEEPPKKKEWCFSEMKKQWRRFNIDLQPKILYCRGPMVELLISSDIAKYCEFKSITRVLTLLDDKLQKVPCSRADVFSSRQVSMIEKRMLMKLLTFCMEFDKHPHEYQGFEDKTFDEFLASRKLTDNVRHYVKYAIAMGTAKTTTLEGLKSTQKFLRSLGRYGNTAFLWPLYGSGEMPQCFCRMCAVFGGIYCLRRTGVSLIVDNEKKCKGIIDSEGQRLDAKWVIIESSYTTGDMVPKEKPRSISRGIFIIDRSLQPTEGEDISLLTMPHPEEEGSVINVIEVSPTSMACPKDTHMVHMTCKGSKGPEQDFAVAIKTLFQPSDPDCCSADDNRPKVMWSLMFSQEDTTGLPLNNHGLDGLFVVSTPDGQLDFDNSIQEARSIFEKICPGDEFLPRAPNPEDIIYDDDQQGPNAEGSGFEPSKDSEEDKAEAKDATKEETKGDIPSDIQTEDDKVSRETASNLNTEQNSQSQSEETHVEENVKKEDASVAKS